VPFTEDEMTIENIKRCCEGILQGKSVPLWFAIFSQERKVLP